MSLIYSVFTIGCCFSTSLGCEISIMYIYTSDSQTIFASRPLINNISLPRPPRNPC